MYKNFTLTESEREQILNQHMNHGYKQPINEQGYIDGPGRECYRYGEIFVCVNDKSGDVENLQKDLNKSACQKGLPPIQVDGVFGPKTKERIMINQKSKCKLPFDFNTQQYRRVKTETGERYVPVQVSGTNLG
jgi:peptidoglycan hydrolase-like protein with peptidoglycan-binding domain